MLFSRVGGPERQELLERRADASAPERVVLTEKSFGHSVGDGRWLPDHRTLIVRTYADPIGSNVYTTTDGGNGSSGTDVAPSVSSLGSAASFDVTADGRIIVVEDVPGAFDLVLVRNGLTAAEKASRR